MKNIPLYKYLLINTIFITLYIGGYLYLKYAPTHIQCYYKAHYGFECPTCGLTRDFSHFLSLNFQSPINPHSYYYFAGFSLIFLTRILHSLIAYYKPTSLRYLLIADALTLLIFITLTQLPPIS